MNNSQFIMHNSQCIIHNSQFIMDNLQLTIHNEQFIIEDCHYLFVTTKGNAVRH